MQPFGWKTDSFMENARQKQRSQLPIQGLLMHAAPWLAGPPTPPLSQYVALSEK